MLSTTLRPSAPKPSGDGVALVDGRREDRDLAEVGARSPAVQTPCECSLQTSGALAARQHRDGAASAAAYPREREHDQSSTVAFERAPFVSPPDDAPCRVLSTSARAAVPVAVEAVRATSFEPTNARGRPFSRFDRMTVRRLVQPHTTPPSASRNVSASSIYRPSNARPRSDVRAPPFCGAHERSRVLCRSGAALSSSSPISSCTKRAARSVKRDSGRGPSRVIP